MKQINSFIIISLLSVNVNVIALTQPNVHVPRQVDCYHTEEHKRELHHTHTTRHRHQHQQQQSSRRNVIQSTFILASLAISPFSRVNPANANANTNAIEACRPKARNCINTIWSSKTILSTRDVLSRPRLVQSQISCSVHGRLNLLRRRTSPFLRRLLD